jgi:hypothetical protein
MNLQEQIGALETGVDQLIRVATTREPVEQAVEAVEAVQTVETVDGSKADARSDTQPDTQADAKPTLHIERPSQNELTMTIGGQSVTLHPLQVGQLVEELANARASMEPEVPPNLPQGWRFVSTKNPMMAVQKQSNGDRLLVMRHTGHGWVPFQFSPDMVIQMYMLLTQK